MKKLLLTLVLSAFYSFCYSQKIIKLKFDPLTKKFDKESKLMRFSSGVTYKVMITGINTSVIDYRISAKAYTLSPPIPEIIKPLFPGITEGFVIDLPKTIRNNELLSYDDTGMNDVYKEAAIKYTKLSQLKVESDLLYNQTKSKSDTGKAKITLETVKKIFNVKSINDLKLQASLYIKYIVIAQELSKKRMEASPTDKNINSFANLSIIVDSLKSKNYLEFVDFISSSVKARDYIEYIPFKAEKDLIDLKLTFIDRYKKDTVYSATLPFYTRGNFKLDFSTGFFWNNLYENSYYLEKRDTLKNNVLNEKSSAYDVSIGALGHLSYKVLNCVKIGASMGAALSPFDGKMRYLLGLSLMFGRRNEFAINGGYVLAKIKVLSQSVKKDDKGNYVPIGVTSVPTYEKIESGIYLGLTYNLNSIKK